MSQFKNKKRKSLAERIRESGSDIQKTLDQSLNALDNFSAYNHSIVQPGDQPGDQVYQITDHLVGSPTRRSTNRSTRSPSSLSENFLVSSPGSSPTCLSYTQAILYFCLKYLDGKPTNLKKLETVTGISEHTLKSAIYKLKKYKVIDYKGFCKYGKLSGFQAIIKKHDILYSDDQKKLQKTINIIELSSLSLTDGLNEFFKTSANIEKNHLADHLADHLAENLLSSRSCTDTETTTKENFEIEIDNNPDLNFWKEKGLKGFQISKWLQEFPNIKKEELIASLCHCAYDMKELGREKKEKIRNSINYFYHVIKKAGFYPSPQGYKSIKEKALEAKEKWIKDQEDLKKREQEAEEKHKFLEMMNNPEGELYKKCYASLNEFERKMKPGKAYEVGMMKVLKTLMLQENK
jgi:hypothetical protein